MLHPPRLLGAALCLALAACSPGKPVAGRPAPASPSPAISVSASAAPLLVGKIAPPPVRLFAGVRSITGTPVRYCLRGRCVDRPSAAPRLVVEPDSVVTFAAGRAPQRATIEVAGRRIPLTAGTLMAYPGRLARGTVRMRLALEWPDAEGTWLFELTVKRT